MRQRLITNTLAIVAVIGGVAVATTASATVPFGPKSSREVMPAREIERPLDMPRAWSEFTLGHTVKLGTGAWSPDGEVEPFENARWTYHTTLIRWRYGLARRSEMAWDVPIHVGNLKNDVLGTNTTSASVGDIRFRYIYQLYESDEAPMTSAVVEAELKGPTGRETPGTYVGGPNQVSNFIFSTGTWDFYLGVAGKKQVGPAAFTGRLGYQRRFSGNTQFVVETTENQFVGRFKPGDRLVGEIEAMGQLGPVALALRPTFMLRGPTKMGVTAKNWFNPGQDLVAIEDSDGWSLDLNGQLTLNATRGFDVHLQGSFPLRGEDLQLFPLEDIHPTYGPSFGGAVEVRF